MGEEKQQEILTNFRGKWQSKLQVGKIDGAAKQHTNDIRDRILTPMASDKVIKNTDVASAAVSGNQEPAPIPLTSNQSQRIFAETLNAATFEEAQASSVNSVAWPRAVATGRVISSD